MSRLCAVLVLSTLLASSLPSRSSAQGSDAFRTPSKNIDCLYVPADGSVRAQMVCEVHSFAGKVPVRPKDCELDWVPSASVDTRGRVTTWSCQGDTIANPAAPALAYGATWKRGQFTCTSKATGVRCLHRSGHGFEVSRVAITSI